MILISNKIYQHYLDKCIYYRFIMSFTCFENNFIFYQNRHLNADEHIIDSCLITASSYMYVDTKIMSMKR